MNDAELLAVVKVIDIDLRADEDGEPFDAIIAWLSSEAALRQFRSYIEGLLLSAMEEQIDISNSLIGAEIEKEMITAEWLRQLNVHLQFIQNTTVAAVQEAIVRGVENGDSIEQIAQRIQEIFIEAGKTRAAVIARTETLSSMNHAAFEVYKAAGVPYKSWSTILDGRERDTHNHAHGQRVRIDEPFDVGGDQLMFPGDPSGSPSEIINCRCTVLPEFDMERVVWTSQAMEHMVNAYLARQGMYETLVVDAVSLAFESQRARVMSILRA